jgi:hypothetical protein
MAMAVISPLLGDYTLTPTRLSHKGDDDNDDYNDDKEKNFRHVRINSENRLSASSSMSSACPPHISAQFQGDEWL